MASYGQGDAARAIVNGSAPTPVTRHSSLDPGVTPRRFDGGECGGYFGSTQSLSLESSKPG
jgi:hypothetical protein